MISPHIEDAIHRQQRRLGAAGLGRFGECRCPGNILCGQGGLRVAALHQAGRPLQLQAALAGMELEPLDLQATTTQVRIQIASGKAHAGRALQHGQILAGDGQVHQRRIQRAGHRAVDLQRTIDSHVGAGEQVGQLQRHDVQIHLAVELALIEVQDQTVVVTQPQALPAPGRHLLADAGLHVAIQGLRPLATQLPLTSNAHVLQHVQVLLLVHTQQLMQPQRGQFNQAAARLVLERAAPVQQQALQVDVPIQRCQPEIRQRQATAVHRQRRRVDQAHGGAAAQIQRLHAGPIAGAGAGAWQRQRALQAQLQPVLALPGGGGQLVLGRRAVQAQVQRIQNVGARAQLARRQRQLHGCVLPRLRLQRQRRRQIQLQVLQAQAVRLARLIQSRPVHAAGTCRGLGAQILKASTQMTIQIHAACSAAIQSRQVAKLHADIQPILRGPQRPLGLDAVGRAMGQLQVDVLQRQRLPLGIQLGLAVQAAGQRLASHATFHQFQPHRGLLAGRHQAPLDGPVRTQHALTPGRVHGQCGRQPLRQVQPAGRAAQVQVPGSADGRLTAGGQQRLAQRNPPFVQLQPARVQRAGQLHLRIGRQLLQISRQQGAHLFGALRQIHQELLAIHLHLSAQGRPGQPLPERGQIQSGQLQVTLQAGQRGPRNGHRLGQPAFKPPLDAGFALGGDGHGLGSLRFLSGLTLAGSIAGSTARLHVGRGRCHGPGVSRLHTYRQADGQVIEPHVEM